MRTSAFLFVCLSTTLFLLVDADCGRPASSCKNVDIFRNQLGANWHIFSWSADVNQAFTFPADNVAWNGKTGIRVDPSGDGGLIFRSQSQCITPDAGSYFEFLIAPEGPLTITVQPNDCDSATDFGATCSPITQTVNSATYIRIPIACAGSSAPLSGFRILWKGSAFSVWDVVYKCSCQVIPLSQYEFVANSVSEQLWSNYRAANMGPGGEWSSRESQFDPIHRRYGYIELVTEDNYPAHEDAPAVPFKVLSLVPAMRTSSTLGLLSNQCGGPSKQTHLRMWMMSNSWNFKVKLLSCPYHDVECTAYDAAANSGNFKPMTWTPVTIPLDCLGSKPFEGFAFYFPAGAATLYVAHSELACDANWAVTAVTRPPRDTVAPAYSQGLPALPDSCPVVDLIGVPHGPSQRPERSGVNRMWRESGFAFDDYSVANSYALRAPGDDRVSYTELIVADQVGQRFDLTREVGNNCVARTDSPYAKLRFLMTSNVRANWKVLVFPCGSGTTLDPVFGMIGLDAADSFGQMGFEVDLTPLGGQEIVDISFVLDYVELGDQPRAELRIRNIALIPATCLDTNSASDGPINKFLSPSTYSGKKSHLPAWEVALIVIGTIVVAFAVLVVAAILYHRSQSTKRPMADQYVVHGDA